MYIVFELICVRGSVDFSLAMCLASLAREK